MARHLWFKKKYVEPILDGSKVSTVRLKRPRVDVGDEVTLHVGPRPPFATVVIRSIAEIPFSSLSASYQRGMRQCYGLQESLFGQDEDPDTVWRVRFILIK